MSMAREPNIRHPGILIETSETRTSDGKRVSHLTDICADRIQDALDSVNGRAAAFAVIEPHLVYRVSRDAEARLDEYLVPIAERTGAMATFVPSGPQAAAYGHSAISTRITLTRRGRGWHLTSVERVKIWPRNPPRFIVSVKAKAIDAACARIRTNLRVIEAVATCPEQPGR